MELESGVDGYIFTCCDLDLLTRKPNQYVSWPRYMWPKFDEISSTSYEDIVLTRYFGSLGAVTLTFDLLTKTFNHHIYETKYVCDQNWVKFP